MEEDLPPAYNTLFPTGDQVSTRHQTSSPVIEQDEEMSNPFVVGELMRKLIYKHGHVMYTAQNSDDEFLYELKVKDYPTNIDINNFKELIPQEMRGYTVSYCIRAGGEQVYDNPPYWEWLVKVIIKEKKNKNGRSVNMPWCCVT